MTSILVKIRLDKDHFSACNLSAKNLSYQLLIFQESCEFFFIECAIDREGAEQLLDLSSVSQLFDEESKLGTGEVAFLIGIQFLQIMIEPYQSLI